MAQYFNGTTGDVTIGGVALKVKSWKFTDTATELDTTNVGTAGFYQGMTGIRKGTFECEAYWDGDIDYDTPPVLVPGTEAAASFDIAENAGSFDGNATVQECGYTHDLDAVFVYSLKGFMSGSYTIPGQS